MKTVGFPFAAIVGLDTLKLALQLAAIDFRLSVLVRGDKGAGKSTAARGLSALMDAAAPFLNLPIGATEDRLLGGLDVEKALKGEPSLRRGLLAEANGGVLYIDEVNLLPDHLADALLDAVASGVHTIEREGFSATQSANFAMIGSMNPEEGALRPQLLDRFALAVDVEAPADPLVRAEVLARRLTYDAAPNAFDIAWADERAQLASTLARAKSLLPRIDLPRELLEHIATRVAEFGVRSLRADLAVARASRAFAALETASVGTPRTESLAVSAEHIETVLPLALAHRSREKPRPHSPPPQQPALPKDQDQTRDNSTSATDVLERVFAPLTVAAPKLVVETDSPRSGDSARTTDGPGGVAIRSRQTTEPRELDMRATLLHAATRPITVRTQSVRSEDLHERVRVPRAGVRYIIVVDSSGSHAVQERMRLVKGAVAGLLDRSHGRHDEVVIIGCRGPSAQVVLEPTGSRDAATQALEYLPTGGRTPLAHALAIVARYVNAHAVVVVVTDGRANVPMDTDDAWADALTSARAIACPALVIDTEDDRYPTGQPATLAGAMGATLLRLNELDQSSVVRLIREVS